MCVIVSDVGECYLLCVHMCVIVSDVGECYLLCVHMCVIVMCPCVIVDVLSVICYVYTCVLSSPT